MASLKHWIIQCGSHITETFIWSDGGDVFVYYVSPDNLVKRGDIVYFWLNHTRYLFGWGEVIETPQVITEVSEPTIAGREPMKRKRQAIKVHRKKGFSPPITETAMYNRSELRRIIPPRLDDVHTLPITNVQANYINDFAREFKLEPPDGSSAVKITYEETMPQFMMKSIISFGDKTSEGQIVRAVMAPWLDIIDMLLKDPEAAYQIDPRMWEEIVAGIYHKSGFDSVILTPRSGDLGRDVIAEKKGVGFIRVIDQVKAYKPGHVVKADEVRALAGVLQLEGASKGFLTTTSDFAPKIRTDPLLSQWIPSRLQLIDGPGLIKRLVELR